VQGFPVVPNQNLIRVTGRQVCYCDARMLAFLTRIVLALRSVLDRGASRETEILVLRTS